MQPTYQIVFVAPQNSLSHAEVVENLARLYQTSKARIQQVLQQPHPVLKRVKTLAEAQKYQSALARHGIQCEIRVAAPPVEAPAAQPVQVHAIAKKQPHIHTQWGRLTWLLLAAVVIVAVSVSWQAYQQQRIARYNDKVVVLLENAVAGFAQILRGLLPYGQKQAVDTLALQRSYEQTMQQLQQAYQEISQIEVPPTASCTDFQRTSLAFISYQMQEGKRIADILTYLAAHNPGSEYDILVLRKRLHRVGREESQYQLALQQAQETMAQTFRVALK